MRPPTNLVEIFSHLIVFKANSDSEVCLFRCILYFSSVRIEENETLVVFLKRFRETSIREYIVPPDCINGTFRWDYPRKTVELHFTNLYHNQMSVCVRNGMLGNIFTVRDVTHTFGMPMIIGGKCCPIHYAKRSVPLL